MNAITSILLLAVAPAQPVTRAVVYPDRALVTRAVRVACEGHKTVRFGAIPPSADPASIRATSTGGTIDGLVTEEHTLADSFSKELTDLDEKIRVLGNEARAHRDAIARGDQAARLAAQLTETALALIGRELHEAKPNTAAWGAALDTALAARTKSSGASVDENGKLRELARQVEELQRKRARMAAAAGRTEYLAEVLVGCADKAGEVRVELSYLVGGASWEPAYEARADEAGGVVVLSTWATVRQATGEDWRGAEVVLSTALPREEATPPEIQRLYVTAEERKAEKKVLVRRDEEAKHAESGGGSENNGAGGLRAASQGLSVQLQVPEAADVVGDGSPVRLFVAKSKMKARFAYRTVPKQAPFVYRVADLVNEAPFPLLAGPLDAFRDTGLIARHALERVAQGAAFHLTFGIEDGLRVKRIVIEEVQRDAGLLGGTRRFRFSYRYEIESYLGRAGEVELAEHIPVSELDDVKVSVDEKTTAGYARRDPDGILTWKVALTPRDKKTVNLAFRIDAPSSYDTGGL